ncbi:DUF896 domain-containing protein [Bacillus horti]|uniref:UPF0291 protein J2S11_003809 n=1 Tax=Caldalkalibacillus horti TaxID=77523 RepID=A0ABT9W3S1_9BACI|nr:DUF896 domain-containing protein [Bacillus horti]MDQ0167879.1 uncharacterized protein YnzC (UPF0291/DUF896 family) [Bacillus horti]
MLSTEKIQRINELAKKDKESGLTNAEKEEQKELRAEYLKTLRSSLKSDLMNVTIVDPNGDDVTPQKLKNEQAKRKKH